MSSKYNIPILTKGMRVLELISEQPLGMTLQEIVNAMQHSKTSVYRILCSLEEMGYLRKDASSGKFFLTRKLFKLGLSTLGTATIIEHAYEPMRQLRDLLKETVVLGALVKNKVVIMEQILGSHHFSFMVKPGMEVCLHASAPGKVILAYMEEQERNELMQSMEYTRFNDQTITDRDTMAGELERTLEKGYGLDLGEELTGVHCIGAPVFNQYEQVAAAVWITGPSDRLSEGVLDEYAQQVVRCAQTITQKIGYGN